MESLLAKVNELQKLVNLSHVKVDISLPQIVVVGAQSAGKSSVLESIVGKDFLPRGQGIVTRMPLIIQCHNDEEEFAIFQHLPSVIFKDFAKVRDEIIAETNKKAGSRKAIVDQPILLEIYSPLVVNITLVDLPGLTKNPVGDQPRNISVLIEEMVLDYIKKENAIILAISPGNNDIANSDALKIARDVDPRGERTLGVLTKLDIMDKGTSAINVLLGEEYPLAHGYVGVVCRSQADITNNVSILDHLDKEAEFFRTHPDYKLIQDQAGIPYLTQRLQEILFEKLKRALPSIKEGIDFQLEHRSNELENYGDPIGENKALQQNIIIKIASDYCRFLEETIEGRTDKDETGTQIRKILFSFFEDKLKQINPMEEITDNEILEQISSTNGIHGTLLIPEQTFRVFSRKAIESIRAPSFQILHLVKDSLLALTQKISSPYFSRFKNLHLLISEITEKIIEDKYESTYDMIKRIFDMENNYINIHHPDFIGGRIAIEKTKKFDEANGNQLKMQVPVQGDSLFGTTQNNGNLSKQSPFTSLSSNQQAPAQNSLFPSSQQTLGFGQNPTNKTNSIFPSSQQTSGVGQSPTNKTITLNQSDLKNIELVRILVKSYFGIVRKNIGDYVPKAILSFLIHDVQESLKDSLVAQLLGEKFNEKILDEGKIIPKKREDCKEAIALLRGAKNILRNWNISSN
ncbi:unnamed protein product [Blepharisma stoltei]|uniref:Uncharacterized protein n=1 Tax=Blepharisma stoltei TaxID=1481888 RepID=A0AAU9IFB7_9CILI|nr:unnamed protein product [Blepharisma stoltei]